MSETYYFSHDYSARCDEKIKQLIRRHGMEGYGVFWAIVEDLYLNANALRTDCEGIAYDLRVHSDIVHSIIHDFGLFTFEGEKFRSESVERRLQIRNNKSINARKSALKRWNDANAMRSHSDGNANAMRPECNRNAIKESKVKESKVKENKEIVSRAAFAAPSIEVVMEFAQSEGLGTHNSPQDFHDYYTSNGWKVGRQSMKDWKAAFRRWTRNEKTFENAAHKQAPLRGLSARTQADWDALKQWGTNLDEARVRLFGGTGQPET